jgi:hypothetical protein
MFPARPHLQLREGVLDRVGLRSALQPLLHRTSLMIHIWGLMQGGPTLVEIPRASVPR